MPRPDYRLIARQIAHPDMYGDSARQPDARECLALIEALKHRMVQLGYHRGAFNVHTYLQLAQGQLEAELFDAEEAA